MWGQLFLPDPIVARFLQLAAEVERLFSPRSCQCRLKCNDRQDRPPPPSVHRLKMMIKFYCRFNETQGLESKLLEYLSLTRSSSILLLGLSHRVVHQNHPLLLLAVFRRQPSPLFRGVVGARLCLDPLPSFSPHLILAFTGRTTHSLTH